MTAVSPHSHQKVDFSKSNMPSRPSRCVPCATNLYSVHIYKSSLSLHCPYVQLGSCALGLRTSEGVLLAVEKRLTSPLLEQSSVEKV